MKKIITLFIAVTSLLLTSCTAVNSEKEYVTLSFSSVLESAPLTKTISEQTLSEVKQLLGTVKYDTDYSITLTAVSVGNYTTQDVSYTVASDVWSKGGSVKVLKGTYLISPNNETFAGIFTDRKETTFEPFTVTVTGDSNQVKINLVPTFSVLYFERSYCEKVHFESVYEKNSSKYSISNDIFSDTPTMNSVYYDFSVDDKQHVKALNLLQNEKYVCVFVTNSYGGTKYIKNIYTLSSTSDNFVGYDNPNIQIGKIYNVGISENSILNGTFVLEVEDTLEEGTL